MWNVKSLICAMVLFGVLGCGGDGKDKPDTVNVSGTVYLDDKPLADAEVNFISEDGKFAAFAKTDSEGKYTLVQGAVPGKNFVTISKIEPGNIEFNPEEGMDEGQIEAMGDMVGPGDVGPKQLVPEEYSDPDQSKLTYDVPAEGDDSADFRL